MGAGAPSSDKVVSQHATPTNNDDRGFITTTATTTSSSYNNAATATTTDHHQLLFDNTAAASTQQLVHHEARHNIITTTTSDSSSSSSHNGIQMNNFDDSIIDILSSGRRVQTNPQNPQCLVTQSMQAPALVQNILKDPNGHIQFRNIRASHNDCFKMFTNGNAMGLTPNDPNKMDTDQYLLPDQGLIMSSGNPDDFCENNSDHQTTQFLGRPGDPDLTAIVKQSNSLAETYDACVIEFEFKCDERESYPGPELSFEYIFGSEEYYEYVDFPFNDAFAFFLNGENIALLPDGVTEVTINNINHNENTQYFHGNDKSESGGVIYPLIEADGFTTKLIASGTPHEEWNTIKLAIADVADRILDSYVLLSARSFTCVERTEAPTKSPTPPPTPFDCMIFDTKPVEDLVEEILKDPEGQAEFQNIRASDHECFLHFYNGNNMGYNLETGEQLIPQEGIIMSTGRPEDFCWNDSDHNTKQFGTVGDADLTSLVQKDNPLAETYDACVIEFDFRCADEYTVSTPEVSFKYMFGSDEYLEYVGKPFNDAFAFYMNGENIALLPDGTTEVTINNVNQFKNTQYYNENDVSEAKGMQYIEIEPDGFTNILTAHARPIKNEWNTIKLVVADVADMILDSYVLLEAGSFRCVQTPLDSNNDSASPSREPSGMPSISAKPSLMPSDLPSRSASPSIKPTTVPSTSTSPSSQPTLQPSISTQPSMMPTRQPSESSSPSLQPSLGPSISVDPSLEPSLSPSESSMPSTMPSEEPSLSSHPTLHDSNAPSISASPSSEPSLQPSISSQPSGMPTDLPS
ncbi:hypothetical protein ACHAXR_012911, partial [Thalassiosira sp. AJA248-18]